MTNSLIMKFTIGVMAGLIAGSWLTGCSPTGINAVDEATSVVEGMPIPQYPLSVNRTIDTDQLSIEN